MAWDRQGLSEISINSNRRYLAYDTDDALSVVLAAGYFNAAAAHLNRGDRLNIVAAGEQTDARVSSVAADGIRVIPASGTSGGTVNVKTFGARGNGTTDDTAAIDEAWSVATTQAFSASGTRRALGTYELFFPPGNYPYSGTGLLMASSGNFALRGISGRTSIAITSDIYFIDISGAYQYGALRSLDFVGGKGVWRVTRKSSIGGAGRSTKVINDCTFNDYTECAIASNNDDDPFYKITDCRFTGTVTSKAIALPPGGGHDVVGNWFNRGRYFIHVRDGQDTRVKRNRFGGLETADTWNIWIDRGGKTAAGNGLILAENYHGTENDSATNSQFLVADSTTSGNASHSTAPTWEAYQHSTTLNTSGIVRGVTIRGEVFSFPSGRTAGVVLSYFERLAAWVFENNHHWGQCPYIFEFRTGTDPLTAFAAGNTYVNTNLIRYDQDHNIAVSAAQVRAACNVPGFGQIYDPSGILSKREGVHVEGAGGGGAAIDVTPTAALGAVSGTTTVASASLDSLGALTNRQVTVNSADGRCQHALILTSAVAGRLTWLEFEAKQGGSNPITQIEVRVGTSFSSYYWAREVALEATVRFYRFCLGPMPHVATTNLIFIGPTAFYSASTNIFEVGRTKVYQAPCPIDFRGRRTATATAQDATPTVFGIETLITANASATTITALDDGIEGQEVLVQVNDANTTVDFTSTTLKGNAGSDWSPANGDFMRCRKIGSNWYCAITDATA